MGGVGVGRAAETKPLSLVTAKTPAKFNLIPVSSPAIASGEGPNQIVARFAVPLPPKTKVRLEVVSYLHANGGLRELGARDTAKTTTALDAEALQVLRARGFGGELESLSLIDIAVTQPIKRSDGSDPALLRVKVLDAANPSLPLSEAHVLPISGALMIRAPEQKDVLETAIFAGNHCATAKVGSTTRFENAPLDRGSVVWRDGQHWHMRLDLPAKQAVSLLSYRQDGTLADCQERLVPEDLRADARISEEPAASAEPSTLSPEPKPGKPRKRRAKGE